MYWILIPVLVGVTLYNKGVNKEDERHYPGQIVALRQYSQWMESYSTTITKPDEFHQTRFISISPVEFQEHYRNLRRVKSNLFKEIDGIILSLSDREANSISSLIWIPFSHRSNKGVRTDSFPLMLKALRSHLREWETSPGLIQYYDSLLLNSVSRLINDFSQLNSGTTGPQLLTIRGELCKMEISEYINGFLRSCMSENGCSEKLLPNTFFPFVFIHDPWDGKIKVSHEVRLDLNGIPYSTDWKFRLKSNISGDTLSTVSGIALETVSSSLIKPMHSNNQRKPFYEFIDQPGPCKLDISGWLKDNIFGIRK